ncbi:glutathione S-transferase [Ceratobasidium sp. AG-Ba]|nr:glutathione S-transferase [Ceratobasidium sp. AG-Ba]
MSDYELLLRLESDAAGYAPSSNSRTDITPEEKLAILRAHVGRRQTLTPFSCVTIDDFNGFQWLSPWYNTRSWFRDGVLVFCSWAEAVINGLEQLTCQIGVIQLPSPNKGIEMRQWVHVESEIQVLGCWFEPKFDLLVLLSSGPPTDCDRHRFHMRTLLSNEPHPKACQDPIVHTIPASMRADTNVRIIGSWLIVFSLTMLQRMVIWDWTTGEHLLDKEFETLGPAFDLPFCLEDNLIFLSERYFMIASLFRLTIPDTCVRVFGVYSLDPGEHSGPCLSQLAFLELPAFANVKLDTFDYYEDPSFQPITRGDFVVGHPSVFETSNTGRMLEFVLGFSKLGEDQDFDDNGQQNSLSLCIPVEAIIRVVSCLEKKTSGPPIVPWEEWGMGVREFHNPGPTRRACSGSRCISFVDTPREDLAGTLLSTNEHKPNDSWTVPNYSLMPCFAVVDFNPTLVKLVSPTHQDNTVERSIEHTATWKHYPHKLHGTASMLAPRIKRANAVENTVAPFVLALFRHTELGNITPSYILMDEEHMIVVQADGDFIQRIMVITL